MADRQDDGNRIGRSAAEKRWFFRLQRRAPEPFTAQRLSGEGRSDMAIAAFGILLGLTCALFPWYIFFNQEKFGIRALRFEGSQDRAAEPVAMSPRSERVGALSESSTVEPEQLDLLATGTLPRNRDSLATAAPGLKEQPYPARAEDFTLVHVVNGRAMIEDDSGLFIVQRGSRLPDNSRVAAIEERNGKWVLVTTRDSVIELEP